MRVPGKTPRAHSSHAASLCELTGILPEQESRARSRHPHTPFQVPRLSSSLSSRCRNGRSAQLLELDKLKVLTPELPLTGVRVMPQRLHPRSWDNRSLSRGCWKDLVKVFPGMPGIQQRVQDSSPPFPSPGQTTDRGD